MRRLLPLLPLLALLLAACAAPTAQHAHGDHGQGDAAALDPLSAGTLLDPPTTLADFAMPSSLGRSVSLADLRGKPTLISFGFTNCPDICPTTLSAFKQVKDELGPAGEQVNFVLVSVDPERDTPEVLAKYIAAFDPSFIGLQGEERELRKIARDFGLFWEKQPTAADGSYDVDHSTAVYLLDREGRISMVYSGGVPSSTYVADLKAQLQS